AYKTGVALDAASQPILSSTGQAYEMGAYGYASLADAGNGLPQGPVIRVLSSNSILPDGTGSVNFGSTFVGTALTKTLTVQNIGTQNLVLTNPTSLPAGFSLAAGFGSTTVAPGASTTFTLKLTALTAGSYSGTVSFGTNDPNNKAFTFTI